MELYIETLTGAAFELRVSPFETIMSVKAKIQRLEGIPIAQQHLIWQSTELEDDYCLHDYCIDSGATLKLVLAMRGGPINTRRIPMEDPALREMADYMEANREEILDKLPGNQQVTLLVFREGDQLNFFRVVDRGDGTLTPLSESLSGASMYNLCDEEDEDEAVAPKDKVDENDKTKEKMKILRTKMESLTLTKKPKKKHHIVRPPSSGRPGSRSRFRRVPSAGRNYSHAYMASHGHAPAYASLNIGKGKPLPPLNNSLPPVSAVGATVESRADMLLGTKTTIPSSAGRRQLESIDSAKLKQTIGSVKGNSNSPNSPAFDAAADKRIVDEVNKLEVLLSRANKPCSPHRLDSRISQSQDVSASKDVPRPPASPRKKPDVPLESIRGPLSLSRPAGPSRGLDRILDNSYEAPGRPNTSRREVTIEALKESLGHPHSSSKYATPERKQSMVLDGLGPGESHTKSGLLRQISIERLGSSRITNFVSSASRSRSPGPLSGTGLKDAGRVPTPEGRLVSARLQRLSASRDGRVMSPSHRLPPVKQKKKATKRCFVCAKKTGLATSYQCRCGNNFCATHRYAEAHDCTFDYKTEGRKLLEQSNPVVSAPKLPKI